ncbi:UQ con domain containing protein [Trichuris trichiura]|uniref:UBC core domain-containing protein n=2 Tax=Trichuris TaxID=36086 RepID=A0A085LUQ7_9BILA|nr:hypothetical protein M513_10414 [Trichuris suis]CDW53133.1 UQ con domain containing protein [Trichuris trichiura]
MSNAAKKRLLQDFQKIRLNPPDGVNASPKKGDLMKWKAVIFGPKDTPYEDGIFMLEMIFNDQYPIKPPQVRFTSRMFHPNVYADGTLCLDILQGAWSPSYDVEAVLTSVQSLLDDPNPSSPANAEAARLFQENRVEYNKRVHITVEESWKNATMNESSGEDKEEEDGDSKSQPSTSRPRRLHR